MTTSKIKETMLRLQTKEYCERCGAELNCNDKVLVILPPDKFGVNEELKICWYCFDEAWSHE